MLRIGLLGENISSRTDDGNQIRRFSISRRTEEERSNETCASCHMLMSRSGKIVVLPPFRKGSERKVPGMNSQEKRPHILMMCPSCAEALDHTHIKKPFLSFLFRPAKIYCPNCRHPSEPKEAEIMAQSYEHWMEQLRLQIEASLSYLPTMTRDECAEVLNPKHFDDDIHHLHHRSDLFKYINRVFKPVLRDRSHGYEDCDLLLSPHIHHGVAKGLDIYGHCGHEHNAEAWTLLITRLGYKDFLTSLTTTKPRDDLIALLETQGAVSIWPTARTAGSASNPQL